jgi:hypothetical protein
MNGRCKERSGLMPAFSESFISQWIKFPKQRFDWAWLKGNFLKPCLFPILSALTGFDMQNPKSLFLGDLGVRSGFPLCKEGKGIKL